MSFKSVLTILSDPAFAKDTLTSAMAFAQQHHAHLDVLCLGVDRSQSGYSYGDLAALALQQTSQIAREEAQELSDIAEQMLQGSTLRWGVDSVICTLPDVARHVAARAQFSDLVVLARPYGKLRGLDMETTLEAALFDAGAPVFVVTGETDAQDAAIAPKTITLAWNESPEALRAAKAALPLMQAAEKVQIVIIDPPAHGPERSDPGGLLSQFLARHGVRVSVEVLSKTMPRVSDLLNRSAMDSGSDLIVMGAYGHSRLRESILGGATRHMLERASLPVMMSH